MRNVAVLGCGTWGKNHVRTLAGLGALAAVADGSERCRRLAEELGAPRTGATLDEILGPDVKAVVVATPAETHHRLARACLERGLDVLVEKPLALSVAEGEELVRLARERSAILMIGHLLEYHPGMLELRRLVEEGELGELRYLYGHRLNLGTVRKEENILWSFAPHDVAVLLRLVGGMPDTAAASGGTWLRPGIADVTVTHLAWSSGIRAHVFVSWLHPWKEQRLTVVGSRRMATFDDVGKRLVLYDQRVDVESGEAVPVKGEGREIAYATAEPLQLECRAFLEAVASRRPPLTDGESGLRVLRVLDAAQRSLDSGGEPREVTR